MPWQGRARDHDASSLRVSEGLCFAANTVSLKEECRQCARDGSSTLSKKFCRQAATTLIHRATENGEQLSAFATMTEHSVGSHVTKMDALLQRPYM